jgi:hypothetical protein
VITPAGRQVWSCFPRFDADPVFSALLGGVAPEIGCMQGCLPGQAATEERYLPDTTALETVWTFWYIDALAAVGRHREAITLFENVLAHRDRLGLLSGDVLPETGERCGNFPQTNSEVGLILAAMRLSRSWEEGLWRAS